MAKKTIGDGDGRLDQNSLCKALSAKITTVFLLVFVPLVVTQTFKNRFRSSFCEAKQFQLLPHIFNIYIIAINIFAVNNI